MVSSSSGQPQVSDLQRNLDKVMQLQPKYDSLDTPEMLERRRIISDIIPQQLQNILSTMPQIDSLGFKVEGGDGLGRHARVPWVRIFMQKYSPKPTEGWYLVYLFSAGGDSVYLSINQGTNYFSNNEMFPKPSEEIRKRADLARKYLTDSIHGNDGILTSIKLNDSGNLGGGYELGNVYAFQYKQNTIPVGDRLESDLEFMLNLLIKLYNLKSDIASTPVNNPQRKPGYWLVGASYGGTDDQTARFYSEGIWENGWNDKYLEDVKSMQPGDRIAIKASYTRKNNLPFDNRGQFVSILLIKATGVIEDNMGDGRRVKVKWIPLNPPCEWYFFTQRGTIWHVIPGNWMADGLIDFAFNGKPQDYDRFRNDPFWRGRFGDNVADKKFQWIPFYEEIANKLLSFQNNRAALIDGIKNIAGRVEAIGTLEERFSDGTTGILKDICPFTTIGLFNRGITDDNRKIIATELAILLDVKVAVPESFEGIPTLNNLMSRFFGFQKVRQPDDIEALWDVFSAAIRYADSDGLEEQAAFAKAYDNANGRRCVGWNLTCGLYWIRPWKFVTLDKKSKFYITDKMKLKIGRNGPKNRCSSSDYSTVMGELENYFQASDNEVHSFPELSLAAWNYKQNDIPPQPEDVEDETPELNPLKELTETTKIVVPYSLNDIVTDGCFIELTQLEVMIKNLQITKNVILQGPPGTGKTWLAKRLAFALVGYKDTNRVRSFQFHPNLSYEDFIRGWRPSGNGKLDLVDGPFVEMIQAALKERDSKFVIVIEEINRGNPAQIFGEMLTLLEADRRTPDCALELCHRKTEAERIYIPDNLHIIGTMNIADRSLALVDFALRRRFAFVDLEPKIGKTWRDWVISQFSLDSEAICEIEKRILSLNEEISADSSLGRQFCIGHSFITPPNGASVTDAREWFLQIINTNIGPLLEEYWFDARDKAQKAKLKLIENF